MSYMRTSLNPGRGELGRESTRCAQAASALGDCRELRGWSMSSVRSELDCNDFFSSETMVTGKLDERIGGDDLGCVAAHKREGPDGWMPCSKHYR
jgi:hypothetical protein